MPSPRTKSGPQSKPLSEVARHLVLPEGIVSTGWPSVRDKCKLLGIMFDPWQDGAGRAILAKRKDGKYAAGVGGVVLSIPRQVGKTFLIGAIVFALCMLFPGLKVIWTAHHTKTADETFESMQQTAGMVKVKPYIRRILTGGGKQVIYFKNGSRIEFGARESGFGRGKTKVGILVLDEASILTEKAMENLVPTVNQGKNPLIFLMGTPPRPIDPGEVFTNRRNKALAGESKDTLYIEFSADRGARLDDRKQWAKANPSYPYRTNTEAILRMREMLPSDDAFRREGLGIWDQQVLTKSLISADHWRMLYVPDDTVDPARRVVGVKFSVDGALVGLSLGVRPVEGPVHVSGIRLASTAEGFGWIVQWCLERRDRIDQIVIDGKGSDAVLIAALTDAGFSARSKVSKPTSRFIRVPSAAEYTEAHTAFLQAVQSQDLSHGDSPTLDEQVEGSMRRAIGNQGGWGWQPIRDTDNATLLDSATLAWWGAKTCTRGRRKGVRVG